MTANASPLRLYRAALARLDTLVEIAIITITSVMIAIVGAQVFMRYVVNRSLDWTDELATLCFVWTVFLALPLALRNGGHIVMEMLLTRLSPSARDRLYRAMALVSIALMAIVAREALNLTIDNWDETIPVLGISGGLYYLAVAIGAAHCALHLLAIGFVGEPRREGIIE